MDMLNKLVSVAVVCIMVLVVGMTTGYAQGPVGQRPDGAAMGVPPDGTPPEMPGGGMEGGPGGPGGPGGGMGMMLDIEAVRAAIAGIADAEALAAVEALLAEYEAAAEAERAAMDAGGMMDEAARAAAEDAREALTEALAALGIVVETPQPPQMGEMSDMQGQGILQFTN